MRQHEFDEEYQGDPCRHCRLPKSIAEDRECVWRSETPGVRRAEKSLRERCLPIHCVPECSCRNALALGALRDLDFAFVEAREALQAQSRFEAYAARMYPLDAYGKQLEREAFDKRAAALSWDGANTKETQATAGKAGK